MLIIMDTTATPVMVERVCREIEAMGLAAHAIPGTSRTVIGVTGNKTRVDADRIMTWAGVKEIIHITRPYRLASRECFPDDTVVSVDGVLVGGQEVVVMAGPCAVESADQCRIIAEKVATSGARLFRGGAYKPRTSPYSFQGLGERGLEILSEVREEFGLKIVTEAIDLMVLPLVTQYADLIQIGARNMQNFSLLKAAGRQSKPVLLKRGMSATLEELLMAAEYVMAEGNRNVILCERGVRTFADDSPRTTLDLSAVPFVKRVSHLPIIVDPSHGTGQRDQVLPLSRAAIAAGADGLLIEVHYDPANALSDGLQAITPDTFDEVMRDVAAIAEVLGRSVR